MARPTIEDEDRRLMDEWLKKNEVTVCPAYARTDPDTVEYKRAWGGCKKKKPEAKKQRRVVDSD